jgi:hypothetical protein
VRYVASSNALWSRFGKCYCGNDFISLLEVEVCWTTVFGFAFPLGWTVHVGGELLRSCGDGGLINSATVLLPLV